jgi:site-specific DNA-cytosine methylase
MGIKVKHCFACDINEHARNLVMASAPPEKMFDDVLTRSSADIPSVDAYVLGFPCTPYSFLHGKSSKLFREKAARPYFKMLQVLKDTRPPMAVLENVIGLNRVMSKVVKDLEGLSLFFICVLPLDSSDLGEPVSRPRYYFLLLRRDAVLVPDRDAIADFVLKAVTKAKAKGAGVQENPPAVRDLMLPNSHPLVADAVKNRRQAAISVRPERCDDAGKWKDQHATFKKEHDLPVRAPSSEDPMLLGSERQKDIWHTLEAHHPNDAGDLVVDVSQSISRCHAHTGGRCGTITPGGRVCVKSMGRTMIPLEKLILHLFPVHQMKFPAGILSSKAMSLLGGNTMHLKAVGLVLAIGLGMLRELPSTSWQFSAEHSKPVAKVVFIGAAARQVARKVKRDVKV